ncbi:MAG: hypothetical protein IPI95_04555 [Flavobacteriales bacterium]|nr:hypothetical protein [Flavobacteriales bacterium]
MVGDVQNERGDGMLTCEFLERSGLRSALVTACLRHAIDGDRLSDQAATQDQYLLLAHLVCYATFALVFFGWAVPPSRWLANGAAERAHEDGIRVDVDFDPSP